MTRAGGALAVLVPAARVLGFALAVAATACGLGEHPPAAEEDAEVYAATAPLARVRGRWAFLGHAALPLGDRVSHEGCETGAESRPASEAPFGSGGGAYS